MFERILALFDKSTPSTPLPPADAKFALGALMVRTAMADKAYLFQEVEEIDRVLAKMYGLKPLEAAKMRAQCEKLEHELPRTEDLAAILTDNISEEKREAAVAALWDVVYADGNRHAKEDLLVGEIAGLLGVDEATCERIRDEEVANWDKNH
ncbi:tellurite resistance TerB family protein [Marivita geojedonensis]|uniref:tellurite resistance TerB family protein n=1 Tax=Marivita geojedonensis TaxID=1123756 RepID=UPI000A1F0E34|nr:TerB family tellurite resistance protein [Marivita geojedonensis]PRY81635.1 putative tellurite resistance protein B-like protein [Marivita geojedonensis]